MSLPRRLLASVLLGLATTIAVSWTVAGAGVYGSASVRVVAARHRSPEAGEGTGELRANVFSRFGGQLIESVARGLTYLPPDPPAPAPELAIPAWARSATLPWGKADEPWPAPGWGDRRVARGTGWPLIALWHEYRWVPGGPTPPGGDFLAPGAIRLEPNVRGNPGAWPVTYPRALPLRPAWLGLAVNTLAFGAGWWAVLAGFGAVRSRFRRRAGHCPACGYCLAGLAAGAACPECGGNTVRP